MGPVRTASGLRALLCAIGVLLPQAGATSAHCGSWPAALGGAAGLLMEQP